MIELILILFRKRRLLLRHRNAHQTIFVSQQDVHHHQQCDAPDGGHQGRVEEHDGVVVHVRSDDERGDETATGAGHVEETTDERIESDGRLQQGVQRCHDVRESNTCTMEQLD